MKLITAPQLKIITVVLILAAIMAGVSGCSGNKSSPTPSASGAPSTAAGAASAKPSSTASAAASTAVVPAVAAKTTPPAAPKTTPPKTSPVSTSVPKLNDVAFTLSLDNGQQYAENTTPIYLKASQILHMNWLVSKGGNYFYMTVTLPTGAQIAIRNDGEIANYVPGESTAEKLTRSGDLVFSPVNNDWTDGYYLFHPQIYKNDASVTVKLLYWIEG
jgi:hypothetical protein